MSRSHNRSLRGFMRAWGVDGAAITPQLTDDIRPVVIVDDMTQLAGEPPSVPRLIQRINSSTAAVGENTGFMLACPNKVDVSILSPASSITVTTMFRSTETLTLETPQAVQWQLEEGAMRIATVRAISAKMLNTDARFTFNTLGPAVFDFTVSAGRIVIVLNTTANQLLDISIRANEYPRL